jgi:hypothetical protein
MMRAVAVLKSTEALLRVLWAGLLLVGCGQSPSEPRGNGTEILNKKAYEEGTDITTSESPVEATSARGTYLSCVRSKADLIGKRDAISVDRATQIVSECESLLSEAATEVVARMGGRPMTNLPAGMETEQVRMSVARDAIKHEAKMLISRDYAALPRPVP